MSINNGLKAYVRYDGTGRIVPGGPIFSHTKPKNGDWVEIDSLDCCTSTTTSTSTSTSTTTSTTTQRGGRKNWLPFATTIFRTGFETDRASWWVGNTVANVTATNPDYIFTGIANSEKTGGTAFIQSRTLQADALATPDTIVPTYTFFDNITSAGITHNLQDYYDYTVKIINNSFLASRNPTIVIKRASLPQVGLPIDGWFIVTIDFDATGDELYGYDENGRSYNNINLPAIVVVPWAYNSLDFNINYSGGPIPMQLGPDSTTWVNGVTVLPSGWTVEENFPIPGTW
jgi:hypothetical protein